MWLVAITFATLVLEVGANRPRIVGGTEPDGADYPFVVYLTIVVDSQGGKNILKDCTGSILHEKWTLTAGHCVTNTNEALITDPSLVTMQAGYHKGSRKFTQSMSASAMHPHDEYIVNGKKNSQKDVCIMQGSQPWTMGKDIGIIKLGNKMAPAGTLCTSLGFGSTGDDDSPFGVLYMVQVVATDCKDFNVDEGANTCLKGSVAGTGLCVGDSGGPMVCNGKQYGIHQSIANGDNPQKDPECTDKSTFGIIVVPRAIRPWIFKVTGGDVDPTKDGGDDDKDDGKALRLLPFHCFLLLFTASVALCL